MGPTPRTVKTATDTMVNVIAMLGTVTAAEIAIVNVDIETEAEIE